MNFLDQENVAEIIADEQLVEKEVWKSDTMKTCVTLLVTTEMKVEGWCHFAQIGEALS